MTKLIAIEFLTVLILAVSLEGCTRPYFKGEAEAVGHLRSHVAEFERLAETWGTVGDASRVPLVFCNFGSDDLRWDSNFIHKVKGRFVVRSEGEQHTHGSLEEVAASIGASTDSFKSWIEITDRLKIYCIERDSEAGGLIHILLAGSDWSPYGFRYALLRDDKGLAALTHYASVGGMENTDTKMKQIFGRWFYFEAKGR